MAGLTLRISGDIHAPGRLSGTLDSIVGSFIDQLLVIGERSAKSNIPKDTSAGARSIVSARSGLMGEVSSPLEYVSVMDQGRRSGAKMPPPAALLGWIRRHGLGLGASWSVKSHKRIGSKQTQQAQDLAIAFVIARSIGRKGIKGRGFFAEAARDMVRGAQGAANAAVRDVQRVWSKGA